MTHSFPPRRSSDLVRALRIGRVAGNRQLLDQLFDFEGGQLAAPSAARSEGHQQQRPVAQGRRSTVGTGVQKIFKDCAGDRSAALADPRPLSGLGGALDRLAQAGGPKRTVDAAEERKSNRLTYTH